MIDLGTLGGLHRHGHQLDAYCPRWDRWRTLPVADLIMQGLESHRLPMPVTCSTCGSPGRLQVRRPVPTRGSGR